jgi:fructose-specific PTS system IIA-like component
MVEVPAVAFMIEELCQEVDFFSIGTNDLIQYFVAADRSNREVATLYTGSHPAFLRFLKHICDQIHRAGMWVGICGDMAAERRYLPLLIALGLDELSVPAIEIRELKREIARLARPECAKLLEQALRCREAAEVDGLLASHRSEQPESLLSEDLVLLDSTSQSKEEVMQEMVDALYVTHRTHDRQLFEEALWAREAVYSTGLGYGFATPHCKTDAINSDSICVLRLNGPIHWGSVDGEGVRMVVLLALRSSENGANHMQVFSTLARKLMNEDFRQHLVKSESARQVITYLGEQLGIANNLET